MGDHARRARPAAPAEASRRHGLSLRALRQGRPAAPLRRGGRSCSRPCTRCGPGTIREATRGEALARRRGRGHDLYNLRAYRAGDEPHLIHWPTTRQVGQPHGAGARGGGDRGHADRADRLRRGGRPSASSARSPRRRRSPCISSARGTGVELAGAAGSVPLDRGRGQERRDPDGAGALRRRPGRGGRSPRPRADGWLREIRISLDCAPMTLPLVLRLALYAARRGRACSRSTWPSSSARAAAARGGRAPGGRWCLQPRAPGAAGRLAERAASSCRSRRWPRWWTSPTSRRASSTPWCGSSCS